MAWRTVAWARVTRTEVRVRLASWDPASHRPGAHMSDRDRGCADGRPCISRPWAGGSCDTAVSSPCYTARYLRHAHLVKPNDKHCFAGTVNLNFK
ncbi:hypothetical protein E2C01_053053 [Portunus trituberculatus]|uniref:Uncharacterized protein n=1 Tax=Portunus trituberculatus TaxID=210409 RepID=A0A5B7GPS5_PORTR|nr:hypothetical protein [Portunus trituberculatus]